MHGKNYGGGFLLCLYQKTKFKILPIILYWINRRVKLKKNTYLKKKKTYNFKYLELVFDSSIVNETIINIILQLNVLNQKT